MAGSVDLAGHRILVLEDSYYLASDIARALRAAKAEVVGPFSTEAAALANLAEAGPTCALLDINLGAGPTFEVAHRLAAQGIPFAFVTGHDDTVIPSAFRGAGRFEKPVDPSRLVSAFAAMLAMDPSGRETPAT
ncbi:MAG: response regulator [Actinomycetospora chiangmaiensis]|nr:response regulator [Actinomycetospora chiangmaiensis]